MVKAASMRVFYCDHHEVPLPPGHRFPMRKYARLRTELVARRIVHADDLVASEPGAELLRALLRVHEAGYVERFLAGRLDERSMRNIGFPWSPPLVRRTLASLSGTLQAARHALEHGFAGNLAGGTHHAHADHGSGFCVFNDIAVAARALLDAGLVRRVLVVDVDVHQGDGTAAIFADDPRVFTLSVHGARNFPFRKQRSCLDVELPDGTRDEAYLDALRRALDVAVRAGRPDVVFVQGGVDVLGGDRFGRFALTHEGLRGRDRLVLGLARELRIPVVLTLGGGYAEPLDLTVEGHLGTYAVAAELFGGR